MLPKALTRLVVTYCLGIGFVLLMLLAVAPAGLAQGPREQVGEWSDVIPWQNIAIHTHVLPNGKVMYWSRREPNETLNAKDTIPRLWDPITGQFSDLAKPGYNIFCSGHVFLPDGRLFVAGGHIEDQVGLPRASIYDPEKNIWQKLPDMNKGRWYPSALSLANGEVLIAAGTYKDPNNRIQTNVLPEVWDGKTLRDLTNAQPLLPYYPFLHVAPNGQVFLSGPQMNTFFLDTAGKGHQSPNIAVRFQGQRDYGSSVMYDVGKIMVVGGGDPPKKTTEIIDLNVAKPSWKLGASMATERRQLNATLLADGKVLVTGGTSGKGFNNLTTPVLTSELWDPDPVDKWTVVASQKVPRLYHSTAVLLPDGRVLSSGGGEFAKDDTGKDLDVKKDNHADAQIYSPPYLFTKGIRPSITKAPEVVSYGQTFDVQTPDGARIKKVTWIRLSSVTHAYNQNQRLNLLSFTAIAAGLQVTAPAKAALAPPGHYMLFILDGDGAPSVAKIIKIQ